MNQLQTSDSENAPSHSQRDENATALIPRQSLPLGEKDDNIREALRQKLDFKNSDSLNKGSSTSRGGKENAASPKENNPNDENAPPEDELLNNKKLEEAMKQFSNSKSKIQSNCDDEDSDSDEDPSEEEENARNRLKALLGGSTRQKKVAEPLKFRKSHSTNDTIPENNFVGLIHRMKRDLYHKLEIANPDEEDDDIEVSKIFYEGREGQEYAVRVLEKFFKTLTHHAESFEHESEDKQDVPRRSTEHLKKEECEDREEENTKEKIRKALQSKKSTSRPTNDADKESLKSLLGAPDKIKQKPITDINEAIKVDSLVLNYGVVNPGKLLGSILVVSNISDSEQTIDLSLDNTTEIYDKNEIIKNKDFEFIDELAQDEIELNDKELAECITDEQKSLTLENKKRYIPNSENKSECWYIENPKTKDLTKKITLKLGPHCEQEFIIVLKTLQPKDKVVSLSFLNLEIHGIDGKEKYNIKHIQKTEEGDISFQKSMKNRQIQVMLCGVVDPPNLICCKQVYDINTKQNKVPLALKPTSGTQKFRIQFRNNGSKELEADFSFVKIGENKEGEFSMNEYLEFFCMPGTLKIPPKTTSILNVMIKVKMDKVDEAKRRGELKISKNLFKLLIAKLTDSGILFSYFFDVTLAKE